MRLIDADGSYTLNASDNTDYSLCFGGGIISVIDKHGHIACEFFADDTPTIDATTVRHGWWIETIENGKMKRVTSCCADNQTTLTCWYTPRYCPNCGAKMDGVSKKMDEVSE